MADDIKVSSSEEVENILRHMIINSFTTTQKKFRKDYGSMVIGLDGMKNFRKEIHPEYKIHRKKNRENDGMPWHIIFNCMDIIREEAKMYFPWKVVWSDRAETDDVMAVLVEEVANKNMIQIGVIEEPEPVLLDTRDHDMYQLQKYSNVKQWSSVDRKFIRPDKPPKEYLRDMIIGGCKGDGVDNVFSPLGSYANGVRQKACIASRVAPIIKHANIFDYNDDPEIVKRIRQNYQLVCFDGIPLDVREDILESWNTRKKNSKMTMMKYLNEKKCKRLLDLLDDM
jgi:hypothetical protein